MEKASIHEVMSEMWRVGFLGVCYKTKLAVEPELQFELIGRNVFSQQIFQIDTFSWSDLRDTLTSNWRVAGADHERLLKGQGCQRRNHSLTYNWAQSKGRIDCSG